MTATTGPCTCCKHPNAHYAPSRVPDGLPNGLQICDWCKRHLGTHPRDYEKREREHLEMWQEDERYAIELHDEENAKIVEELEQRVADLERQLVERPVQVVTENLDMETVRDAEDHASRSARARDWAFRSLAEIHMLHHLVNGDRCRCGKPFSSCKEADILDGARALRAWEARQAERRKRGQQHSLPDRHPGVVDDRWDPEDDSNDAYLEDY